MRIRFVALLALALGLAPVTTAWAGCLPSHLRGTWRLYAIGGSVNLYTLRCTLTVASNNTGNLTGGSCTDDAGDSGAVTGGRLQTTQACVVTGNVKVAGDPLLTIDHGTLDLDRQTMAGIGEDNTGGIFQFNGIKR
jgi:hypothetical protein